MSDASRNETRSAPACAGQSEAAEPSAALKNMRLRKEIELAASVDEVWKALIDPAELIKWFPLEARVAPGSDGKIFLSWGPDSQGGGKITAWEPGKRLAWDARLAVMEWTIESRGGKTILRLVQSGFSEGAAWEDEWFASTDYGWGFMLAGLRAILERHRGETRLVAWPRIKVAALRNEAYARLIAPNALFTEGVGDNLQDGSPYQFTTPAGEALTGEVEFVRPGRGFCLRVAEWNDALLWATIRGSGELEVQLWLSAFRLPSTVVREWENHWRQRLDKIFRS
jgi:uncharacterized protein YndB with AHSA1/START domain